MRNEAVDLLVLVDVELYAVGDPADDVQEADDAR